MIEPEVSSSGQETQAAVYNEAGEEEAEDAGELPDSTTSSHAWDSNHKFAAALTAKLDQLDSLTDIRGSPPELGEYENPDSMETQGDALCVGSGSPSPDSRDPLGSFPEFDLTNSPNSYQVPDCDPDSTFTSSILPTYGPLPDPAAEPGYDNSLTGGLFNEETNLQSGDLTDESAVPAVCGFRNLGNTCYMNSGLQCLLASPSLVEYFLHFNPNTKLESEQEEDTKSNTGLAISRQFASLVQQVYCGKFTVIQPDKFKEIFSSSHDQFSGFRQHDCQEFLALLLDSLHEQLVSVGGRAGVCPLSECTSMELHTPHSTEVSSSDPTNVFNFNIAGKMLDKDEEREFESVSEVGRADLENVNNIDGMESRGSASPKSYTSHSSLEDKVSASIRMAPIPECIKTDWQPDQGDSRASLASLDSEQDEGSEEGEAGVITSNLVPSEQLKKKTVVFSDTVNSLGLQERNNAVSPMNVNVSMEDFYKEHKTLNVNMNNESAAMNNKISFDSEKFRNNDNTRPATTIENLNTSDVGDKVVNVKRVKCTNMETEGQDSDTKRIRLESSEKNVVMETERRDERRECETEPPSCCAETARDPARLKEAIEADRYWEKYLAKNKTVVAHSFQGQFKNTVICSVCNHVSVSFEPFMYLSVPLPRAVERQVEVVVVLEGEGEAISHLVTLSQHDRVEDLRAALVKKLSLAERRLVLCEVTRHRISRQLEDSVWLRFVNATTRKLYCLEVMTVSEERDEVTSSCEAELEEDLVSSSVMSSSRSSSRSDLASTTVSSSTSTGTLTEDPGGPGEAEAAPVWRSCNICLEEMSDADLISHVYCTAQLCRECLERSQVASPGKCPVCLAQYEQEEWLQLDVSHGVKPPLRMLTLSLIFTTSQGGEESQRFGHPRLVHLPNLCRVGGLVRLLERLGEAVAPSSNPQFRLVAEAGDVCSRCPGQDKCEGCLLQSVADTQGEMILKPGDNIAVTFQELEKNVVEEANRTRQDISMESERVKSELELTDCLDEFSSREVLDEANPWYCPMCIKHQVASRTLSVWRYPDFLVIYLKRFVYLERGPGGMAGSVKLDKRVNFPLSELDLTPYLSGPLQQGGEMFDLYGAVCHYGSVSGGHYTAFVKHCQSDSWNLFNDAQVDARPPEGHNQDDAYVLFYKRSGLSYSLNMPNIASKPSHSISG